VWTHTHTDNTGAQRDDGNAAEFSWMEVDLSFSLSLYAIDTLRSSLACTPAVIHTHTYIYIYTYRELSEL